MLSLLPAQPRLAVRLAMAVAKLVPRSPETGVAFREIFNRDDFVNGTPAEREALQLQSARYRYEYEAGFDFPARYFPGIPPADYAGRSVLDVGCFTGGRLVKWKEKYGFGVAMGVDIDPVFIEAGLLFARERKVDVQFVTGFGERLPVKSDAFDFVTSYDVFEHVRDVEAVMDECYRVLKPGGRLLAVFPPFLQPLEAHLGMVTGVPALHWMFSGPTLAEAVFRLTEGRGADAAWYAYQTPFLQEWERLPSLNGITVARFRRIISKRPWQLRYWATDPILSDGRQARLPLFRFLRTLFVVQARLPILEELFLGRICCVLQKPPLLQ